MSRNKTDGIYKKAGLPRLKPFKFPSWMGKDNKDLTLTEAKQKIKTGKRNEASRCRIIQSG